MWTKKQVLVVSRPDGAIQILPMRYNASHQRGWRCFLGALAGCLFLRPRGAIAWAPGILYLAAALGDLLDGYLARRHGEGLLRRR